MVNGQIVNIPDANLKTLLTQFPCVSPVGSSLTDADTNDDGEIQVSEALAVYDLNVFSVINSELIADLTGLEAFTNLKRLFIRQIEPSTLDISALTQLEELDCAYDNLSNIQFPITSTLKFLYCHYNQLTFLDTAVLSNLEILDCRENQISNINLSGLNHLEEAYFYGNLLSEIDITGLTSLKVLKVEYNDLTSINLSGAINLEILYCNANLLTSLNLSNVPNLKELSCNENQLSAIDVSNLSNLEGLGISFNPITDLNLSGLSNLKSVVCDWNTDLASINLSGAASLLYLTVSRTDITTLDISDSPNVISLDCSRNPYLQSLFVKNGGLEEVYFANCLQLDFICADEGQISTIQQTISDSSNSLYNHYCVINSYCSFSPGGNYNTISGLIAFDANNNGCNGTNETFANIKLNLTDGVNEGSSFSNANGNYSFYAPQGSFTVTPNLENPTWFNCSPVASTISFPNNNNNSSTHNFCVTGNGIHNDLEIAIVPLTTARPGFDVTYKVVFKNKGNQLLSGDINFIYEDDIMDYISSSLATNTQSFGSLNWVYTDLYPFETRSFTAVFNVNSPLEIPAVNIGDQLDLGVNISPLVGDELPADNEFGFKHIVVGSLDPNDKTCLEGNIVSPTKIGEYLHYNINFENTGNFQAENIVVKDMIDTAVFDINSLQVLNASHPLVARILGDKVEFIFEDINLAAQGYGNVTFKIKTKNTLVTGNTVTNKADIYFDYNAPVITNIASTTFQSLGIDENQIDNSVKIYPNPTSNFIQIEANNNIRSIQLFDVQGRILIAKISDNLYASIDISTHQKGVYFLKVKTDNGIKTQKIVKN